MGRLASDVAMPCLIFSALAGANVPLLAFANTALAAIICFLLLGVAGIIGLRLARLRVRTYLPSVTWGNYGFIGLPLALSAFGTSGLAHAAIISAVSHTFNGPLSQIVAAGSGRVGNIARSVMRTPLIYAVAGGVLIMPVHDRIPQCVLRSTTLIGGAAIPLMLIMIGASLANIQAVSLRRALVFSILRTGAGALTGYGVGAALGLSPIAKQVLVLQCTMPVAVLSYVFAQRWNNEPEEIASLVVVSTWCTVVTVPLVLTAIMH
jgi:predicted permease